MQHFKEHRRGGYNYRHEYEQLDDGVNVVDVHVQYDKGGPNVFTGKVSPRGIYVSVTPRKIEGRFEVTGGFKGGRFFILETRAMAPKKELEVAQQLDNVAVQIAEAFVPDADKHSWEKPDVGDRVWRLIRQAIPQEA